MQGAWNLRDPFKAAGPPVHDDLADPGARLPEELAQDVLLLAQDDLSRSWRHVSIRGT